jgi:hypothetical protein
MRWDMFWKNIGCKCICWHKTIKNGRKTTNNGVLWKKAYNWCLDISIRAPGYIVDGGVACLLQVSFSVYTNYNKRLKKNAWCCVEKLQKYKES